MKKYTVEFIGTFFLMLTIGLVSGPFGPLAVGCALAGLIYAGGYISTAHYNPAVSLAFWMCGKLDTTDVPGYVFAQFIGGTLAALIAGFLRKNSAENLIIETGPTLIAELLGTFILVYVILNVAIAKRTAGNSYYGIAIGFTVFGGAMIFGNISGAAFNPAVVVGGSLLGIFNWSNLLIYFIANFAAAALGALAFKYTDIGA